MTVFGAGYSDIYDVLYADKEYAAECDLVLERLGWSPPAGQAILDVGCGTGRHAIEFARRGYAVVGVDRSPPMLASAWSNAEGAGVAGQVRFEHGDATDLRLGERFDAVTMLFAVLSYQSGPGQAQAALETVRNHLHPGGQFVFDVWYQPAVEAIGPEHRERRLSTPIGEVIRSVDSEIDRGSRTCRVTISLRGAVPSTTEQHVLRYFSADELQALLAGAGMGMEPLAAFPSGGPPDTTTWNVMGSGRLRSG